MYWEWALSYFRTFYKDFNFLGGLDLLFFLCTDEVILNYYALTFVTNSTYKKTEEFSTLRDIFYIAIVCYYEVTGSVIIIIISALVMISIQFLCYVSFRFIYVTGSFHVILIECFLYC